MKIIVTSMQIPAFLHPAAASSLFVSTVKCGRPSVYEHFIYEDSILPTVIMCTFFQQRTSFNVCEESGLKSSTLKKKATKKTFFLASPLVKEF